MRNSGMLGKTKISKGFQTLIPSDVRSTFAVEPGDYMEWERGSDGLVIRFRKRKRLRDLEGIGGSPADAGEGKKRAQRGGRWSWWTPPTHRHRESEGPVAWRREATEASD